MPGGSSQGTLWTLLASWFHGHHKDGSRLEPSQGIKKGIWKMEENALIKRLGCSSFITFYNKNYNVTCLCKPWSWWPKTDRMVHLLFLMWLIMLDIISNSPWWSKHLSSFQIGYFKQLRSVTMSHLGWHLCGYYWKVNGRIGLAQIQLQVHIQNQITVLLSMTIIWSDGVLAFVL